MRPIHLNSERGVAAIIALLMMGMLLLIGLAALTTSDDETTIAGNELQEMRAFYAAEAGLEQAAAALQTEYDSTGLPPLVMPSGSAVLNGCAVTYDAEDNGPAEHRPINQGELAGLHALVKSFSLVSTGVSDVDNAKVTLSQTFEVSLVPIFQFAVFYDNDLEFAPSSDMNLIGRVHSNRNLYLQSSTLLRVESFMTAAGHLYHGRKGAGTVDAGDVQIKDGYADYVTMKEGSDWLDAHDGHWYDSAIGRWDGRVQDASHGVRTLNVPLTNASDPHRIIERSTGNPDSYESKATLIIQDGVAVRKMADGTWQNVTAAMAATGALTYTADKFYDQREAEWVDCTELDVARMYDSGFAPLNGVVYFSDRVTGASTFPALRLVNGSTLDSGLSVVSENPLYTLGDFNSVFKKPASLMADAITFLSNSWQTHSYDTLGTFSKTYRAANNTTVNASYLTGNVETDSANYNGGFENLPRFLEDWSGSTLSWKGSAVNLWNSVQADGLWNDTYYNSPVRDWLYDADLDDPNNLPPGTPVVRVFQRLGWRQQYVGYHRDY